MKCPYGLYVITRGHHKVAIGLSCSLRSKVQIQEPVIGLHTPWRQRALRIKIKLGGPQRNQGSVQPQDIFLIAEIAFLQVKAHASVVRTRPSPGRVSGQQAIRTVQATQCAMQRMPLAIQFKFAHHRQTG